jgi:7,8-dihydropterin-6-yl-methyl-4-(beta-D-ribofuranosyl)aminobenzene 5'-phosphate synthase
VASTVTPEPTLEEEVKKVTFTIVYDNNAYDSSLKTAWGFSCLVETGETTVLFDTGGDGSTLLGNMTKLGLDPQAIDAVVLSHIHGDHTGGLAGLLDRGARPTVYLPAAFPASFKAGVRARTELVEVSGPIEILPGVYTTGEMGSGIVEQALAVATGAGSVVVTGCAHPGIVAMMRRGKEVAADRITLAMGGFHLGGARPGQIKDIIAEFRRLGVQRVAPCHCTGDRARRMLAIAFGPNCTLAGVGWADLIAMAGQDRTGWSQGFTGAWRLVRCVM